LVGMNLNAHSCMFRGDSITTTTTKVLLIWRITLQFCDWSDKWHRFDSLWANLMWRRRRRLWHQQLVSIQQLMVAPYMWVEDSPEWHLPDLASFQAVLNCRISQFNHFIRYIIRMLHKSTIDLYRKESTIDLYRRGMRVPLGEEYMGSMACFRQFSLIWFLVTIRFENHLLARCAIKEDLDFCLVLSG
jgi:hypothetical protein